MGLLEAWADWRQPESPPFVLDDDRAVLEAARSRRAIVTHCSWQEARETPDFCAPGDSRLHLGLLPHPFCGDLRRASIYVLLLNPGLAPGDYYAESEVPAFRTALLANLRQQSTGDSLPFLCLDPQFAWHGGFNWWHGKLAGVIESLAAARGTSFAEARAFLASRLASIQLLPYHSQVFRDAGLWLRTLESVDLARRFVAEIVVPRVQSGEAIAIVTRKVAEWGLPDHSRVVTYTAVQARAAHLTPDSPGGRAILTHLGASAG